jgi:tetratricopeptide (TPR) repeat protein
MLRIDLPYETDIPLAAYRQGERFFVFLARRLSEAPDLSGVGEGVKVNVDTDREQDITVFSFILPRREPVRIVQRDGLWAIAIGATGAPATKTLSLKRDQDGQAVFDLVAVRFVTHVDPVTGVRRLVALSPAPITPVPLRQEFPQFAVEATAHGLVVTPFGEGLSFDRDGPTRVVLHRKGGLLLSNSQVQEGGVFDATAKPVIDTARWQRDEALAGLGSLRVRLDVAAATSGVKRALARIDLARLYAAQEMYIEALGPFRNALEDEPALRGEADLLLEQAIYAAMARRCEQAEPVLMLPSLRGRAQTLLWSAYCAAHRGQNVIALMQYRAALPALPQHPDPLYWALSLSLIDVAFAEREYELAQRIINDLAQGQNDPHKAMHLELRRARLAEELGDTTRALAHYEPLLVATDAFVQAAARVAHAELILRTGLGAVAEARAEIERVAISWHGDSIAARALGAMARHYAAAREWRAAFGAARRALERHPDDPVIGALEDDLKARFEELMNSEGGGVSPAQLVALFFDFREFAPAGERGDTIVLKLAHRLIGLDLLDEAGQLLRFQIGSRLQGVARASAAETLAGVDIARQDPQAALRVLDDTRFSDLPADLVRRRLLLQAKALSATKRPHVALDLISGETGPDVQALRADIAWENELWPLAGETIESMLGEVWQGDSPLSAEERALVLRAALAYLRAHDELSLDRLRGKYLAKMSASPDARTFAGLSRAGRLSPLIRTQTPIDAQMMQGFLDEMRKRSATTPKAGPS